jgi:hypothetical protein
VAGLVPGLGEPADALNGVIWMMRGDCTAAALSFAAMVPVAGWAATAGKAGKRGLRWADESAEFGSRHIDDVSMPTGQRVLAYGGGGGGRPSVHSRYADDTLVYEGQQPPRVEGPVSGAQGPHTALRWDVLNRKIYQGREYDAFGNPVRDIDFTNPTYPGGASHPGHPGPPHQHRWEMNDPTIGHRSGFRRLGPEPFGW